MEGGSREKIQSEEYKIPYHYRDLFAPGQGIERKSLFNLVLGLLNLNEGARILDIGCGDGRFCYHAKSRYDVTGIDVDPRAIEWARAFNPESDFYCGDIGEIEIGRYDGAACLEVIEHISDNELPIFMKSILRLLNRDGRAVFSVPTLNQPLSSKHYRHYNEDLLRDFLSSYFDNISIVGHAKSNSILYPLNSALNLISCLFYSETLQWKYPNLIKKVTRLKNKVWYKYFHEDIPSRCNRLIAVCTHKKRQ
jgi:2-polyprenyl-3-methyl-5-hydroxy-6-metoxy-1,4-benzoquinol methylase